MKTKSISILLMVLCCCPPLLAQNGYLYLHNKCINEASALDITYTLRDNSDNLVNTYTLNDLPGSFTNAYDMGAGHASGAGELWAITTASGLNPVTAIGTTTSAIYRRQAGGSTWNVITTGVSGNPSAIDGAYLNQFVFILGGKVYFYYNGSSTNIYTGTNATDVAAANGVVVILAGGALMKWSGSYTTSGPAVSTTWTTLSITGSSGTIQRLDLNATGSTIVYQTNSTTSNLFTVPTSGGAVTSLALINNVARPGSSTAPAAYDVAWDDNNTIYAIGATSVNGNSDIVYSYASAAWTSEPEARGVKRLTGGAGGAAWGVVYLGTGFAGSIWSRTTEGTHQWLDDERIKTNTSYKSNSTMIELAPGTYTITETVPNTNWDVGRFNIYDPSNASTGNVAQNKATVTIAASKLVHVEFISELLRPRAPTQACSQSTLQSFDAGTASGQFGTATFGTEVEGTSYHYFSASSPQDGYYTLVKSLNTRWFVTNSPDITDHTGNGGYFMLVNAAYGRDEFYRQRITNLVPGLDYIIGFWAADALGANPIRPNVSFGMQKLDGTIYGSASTGDILPATAGSNTGAWNYYSVYFTQPAGITTADLFIKNNNIGGNGNDIVIDDITLNPRIAPGSPNVMPAVVCTGPFPYTYFATNPQSGGFWSSGNPSVVAINQVTGQMTPGNTVGSAIITYSISNSVGCVSTSASTVTLTRSPDVTAASNTNAACVGQTVNLSSTTQYGTSPYSYSWWASANGGLSGSTGSTNTATPTATGILKYAVTVTDSNGCKDSDTALVTISTGTIPTVTAVATPVLNALGNLCEGQNTIALTSVPLPVGSYTFLWTGSGITAPTTQNTSAVPVISGAYNVVVVNSQGCYATATTASYTVWPKPTASPTPSLPKVCRQTITLSPNVTGGTSPYTYLWSSSPVAGALITTSVSSSPTVSFSASGTFTFSLTATDSKGCTASGSTPVIVTNAASLPSLGALTASPSPVCEGSTVSLSANRSGGTSPYTFTWSGSGIAAATTSTTSSPATNTALPVATGTQTYGVYVTDANGCSAAATSATITVRPRPIASIFTASNSCFGNTITLTATTTATTANYVYTWTGTGLSSTTTASTSSTTVTNTATAALAGNYTYTVSVTDANGCVSASTASTSASVNFATPPVIQSIDVTPSAVCEGGLLTLSPVISGGTMPFYYSWTGSTGSGLNNSSSFNTTANPVIDANYALLVIDATGCSNTKKTTTITVYPNPEVTLTTSAAVCAGSSISLQSLVSGGSGTYSSYQWTGPSGSGIVSPSSQNTSATPTISGDFTIAVTDNLGCTGSATTNVVVNQVPVLSVSKMADTSCSGSTISTIVFTSNLAATNFYWSRDNGDIYTGNVTGMEASGSGDVSGVLTNATSSAQIVNFSVQAENNGCLSAAQNFTRLVQPVVSATISGSQSICGPGMPAILSFTSSSTLPLRIVLSNGSSITANTSPYTYTVNPLSNTSYSISSVQSVATGCSFAGGAGTAVVTIVRPSGNVGYWQGTTSSDWFNACNWGNGVVPDASIDVFITGTTPNHPFISANSPLAPSDKTARVKNILLASGQSLNVDTVGNAILEVHANWTNQAAAGAFSAGTGTVSFMGTASQTVAASAGSETFYKLEFNNSSFSTSAVILNAAVTATRSLALTNGVVSNGSNLLSLTYPDVNALTGGSMLSYITGAFYRATNSNSEYFFPMGKPMAPYSNYRPAWVIPNTANAMAFTSEYKIGLPPETIENRLVTGILNTEYWNISKNSGTGDAAIKLIYVNPKVARDWTLENPCNECYVGIVKPFPQYSDYWYFTDGNGSNAALTGPGQLVPWQNNAYVYSAINQSFGSFTIGYSYEIILAAETARLTAQPRGEDVLLQWTLTAPDAAKSIVLQHSTDGKKFERLAGVGSEKSFVHRSAGSGMHYYRLQLTSASNKTTYSKLATAVLSGNNTYALPPSPTMVVASTMLQVFSASGQMATVQVSDNAGRTISQLRCNLSRGKNTLTIPFGNFSSGIYLLKIATDDGFTAVFRVVKQ